jgi:hypothetical protein
MEVKNRKTPALPRLKRWPRPTVQKHNAIKPAVERANIKTIRTAIIFKTSIISFRQPTGNPTKRIIYLDD